MKPRPAYGRPGNFHPRRSLFPLLCTAAVGAFVMDSSGATYSFDDLSEFASLSLVPGWNPSEPDPVVDAPLAWVTSWDRPLIGSSLAGAVGGLFDVPTASSYGITYESPVILSAPATEPTIRFDMAIFDSTSAYPGRDSFGFSVTDGSGGSFITAEFRPVVQSATPDDPLDPAAAWEVRYSLRGSGSVSTLIPLTEGADYTMQVVFTDTGVSFAFDAAGSATLANEFFGTPFGYDSSIESIGGVTFSWTKSELNADFGDNYMVVDNVSVVPEPGAISLVAIAAVFPLLIRRRRTTR